MVLAASKAVTGAELLQGLESTGLYAVRTSLCLAMIPLFAASIVPRQAVYCLAFYLAFIAWSGATGAGATDAAVGAVGIALAEAMVGFVLGAFICLPFYVAEAIGNLVDNQSGASFSSQIDPMTNQDASTTGAILSRLCYGTFLLDGGMQSICGLILESYAAMPLGQYWPAESVTRVLTAFTPSVTAYLWLVAKLTFPMIFALAVVDVWLGATSGLNKSLDIFFLSIPVKSLMVVLSLTLAAPYVFGGMRDNINEIGRHTAHLMKIGG